MTEIDINFIKDLAVLAGEKIIEIYDTKFDIEYKEDLSPLTIADQKSNDIITSGLRKKYPNVSILTEEEKDDRKRLDQEYCFIIDPLDGTKEFINKTGEFTVNIALSHKGRAVFGMIYAPVIKKLYYASCRNGAYCEDIVTGDVNKLKVSNKVNDLVWVGSKSHSSEKAKSDAYYNEIVEALGYQISKTISALAAVTCGKVDAIALTGGLSYSKVLTDIIKKRVSFIVPVYLYPESEEVKALAMNGILVLNGERKIKTY